MKHLLCSAIAIFVLLSFTSVYADVIGKTNEEVQEITNLLLDNILDGIKANDYAKYSRDFDNAMKEALPEKVFLTVNQQIRDQMGEYKSREYLGFLNQDDMTVVLWKGTFDKSEDDILIKLVVSKQEDKHLIAGLWFQ